ncbi:hypothetical protein AAY473_025512 [Plecturocebus cupreus]
MVSPGYFPGTGNKWASGSSPSSEPKGAAAPAIGTPRPWAQPYQNIRDLKNCIGYLIENRTSNKQPSSPCTTVKAQGRSDLQHLSHQDLTTVDVDVHQAASTFTRSYQQTSHDEPAVKAISGVHTVKFKNELGRTTESIKGRLRPTFINLMTQVVLGQNVLGPVEAVHLMPFLHACQGPKGTSSESEVLHGSTDRCRSWLTAGDELCPEPRTSEHLVAIDKKLKHIFI